MLSEMNSQKKKIKTMTTTKKSLLSAPYLFSLQYLKQKNIRHWGKVSKAVHPISS